MPYNYPGSVPDYIKGLPAEAQKLFVAAFNSVLEKEHDEEKARIAGWGAVKSKFKQQGDDWVVKSNEVIVFLAEAVLTGRIQCIRTGRFKHPLYGKLDITAADLKQMVGNFGTVRPKAPTEMVVDYEHLSGQGVKTPAAGWVKSLDLADDGQSLWAIVEWTEQAVGEIKRKEYRFISPEFNLHYRDKETGKDMGATMVAIALTNRPFLEGMQPVMLSENLIVSELPASELPDGGAGDKKPKVKEVKLEELKKLLGLPAEADEAAVVAACKGLLEKAGSSQPPEQMGEIRKALGLDEKGDVLATINALVNKGKPSADAQASEKLLSENTGLKTQLEKATTKLAERDRDERISKAIRTGKLLPSEKSWAETYALKDPAGFDGMVASRPVLVNLKELGKETGSDQVTLTEAEQSVAKAMGVDPKTVLSVKQKDAQG